MKGKILVSMVIAGTFFTGCALPQPPSAAEYPRVKKGDLEDYKNMSFNDFLKTLPITYPSDVTRKIKLGCKNINPQNPIACTPLGKYKNIAFYSDVSRELERFCIAKGGYLKSREDERIEELQKEEKVMKELGADKKEIDELIHKEIKKMKEYKGKLDAHTCKLNNQSYFMYVRIMDSMQIATPNWFKSPFEAFTAEPYLRIAKEKGLKIKEYPQYFEISGGESIYDVLNPELFIEEGIRGEPSFFKEDFIRLVLFENFNYLEIETARKARPILNKAQKIVNEIIEAKYPIFKELDYLEPLNMKIDERLWVIIPYKALTKDKKRALLFKPKVWEPIYKQIMEDTKPLLKEYYKLVKQDKSLEIVDDQMFNY